MPLSVGTEGLTSLKSKQKAFLLASHYIQSTVVVGPCSSSVFTEVTCFQMI